MPVDVHRDVDAGVPQLLFDVGQLGHSTIKLTADTYKHWMPGKNREAMDRLPVAIQA